ncbi:Asp23/Gls24 family envelope stress response protein [Streptococcus parasuis]|uniref:Asp23/Gls24 family envelope stress response protein n=1 Tax=Streptococcus parasuis TaxID=1501662 RepID=UPI001C2B7C9C|nr:Asp23/Gls24 family envelope stress response protein [Streptococcus parasuis]MBV1943315.1 Asp23/Gls24 family envelope stress response protein [Streptococcus parasuis]QXF05040.1 Asp23/Gls24 family envelope stress response protein [Streptococcus parasuis]
MTENIYSTLSQPHDSAGLKGEITYSEKVIEKIIGTSLESIDGLLTATGGFLTDLKNKIVNSDDVTEGVKVEVGRKQIAADLRIVVEYGKDIPAIVDQIKSVIREEISHMTHLEVVEVNVDVVDIKTRAEFEADSVTVQDHVIEAGKATGEFVSDQTTKAGEVISNSATTVTRSFENTQVE